MRFVWMEVVRVDSCVLRWVCCVLMVSVLVLVRLF